MHVTGSLVCNAIFMYIRQQIMSHTFFVACSCSIRYRSVKLVCVLCPVVLTMEAENKMVIYKFNDLIVVEF